MKITLTIEIELPERPANVDPVDYEGFKVKVKETKPEAKKKPKQAKITKEIPHTESESLKSKICKSCGIPFVPTWKNQRICSNECRIACKKASKKKANENFRAKIKQESEPKKMPVTLHGPTIKPAGVTGIINTYEQPEHIKPDPGNHKTVVLKSGERLCQHCKEPFKIEKFDQHFCSDSCEVLHRKNHKEPAMV